MIHRITAYKLKTAHYYVVSILISELFRHADPMHFELDYDGEYYTLVFSVQQSVCDIVIARAQKLGIEEIV